MTPTIRTDLPPDAYHDAPWTLLLPWLAQHAAGSLRDLTELMPAPDWWLTESPAVTTMASNHDELCSALARVIMSSHPETPFGELLPSVPRRLPLTAMPLGSRARTTLQRLDVHLAGDLARRSVRELFDVRGTGHGTVEDIVESLVSAAIVDHGVNANEEEQRDKEASDAFVYRSQLPPAHSQVLEDLVQLSRWRHVRGGSEQLLTVTVEDGAPEELQELVTRLNSVTPSDIAPQLRAPDPVADLVALLDGLDERQLLILRERFLAPEPKTLDELAAVLGVSRERVRQIEAPVKELLVRTFHYGTTVGDLLASLRVEIQPVAALSRLVARHPQLSQEVPPVGVPLWLVLDRLDDYFEVADGWAVAPDIAAARDHTRTLLEDYGDAHGVVDLAVLSGAMSALSEGELREWLVWCGYVFHEGKVLARTRSIADHAAAVLAVSGNPLSLDEIVERMGSGRNPRTVANVLADDARFVRTDRATWGLVGWEVAAYTSISHEIGNLLRLHPDGVALAEVIQSITSRFRVSPLSVQAYASGRDFQVVDGIVHIRKQQIAPRKDPADTRRLYREGDVWRLKTTVTADHLRGSGFPLPVAVAGIVGCKRGDVIELASRLGSHSIRWTGLQPSSGTIKRFLDAMDLREGQVIFLEFLPDGRFDIRATRPGADDLDPQGRALALTGASPTSDVDEQRRLLADAVGLPADAKPRQILSVYGRRGDDDIVSLLELAWTRPRPEAQAAGSATEPMKSQDVS